MNHNFSGVATCYLYRAGTNSITVEMAEFSQHCGADNAAFDGEQDDPTPSSFSSPPVFTSITVPENAKTDPEVVVVSMEEPVAGTSSQPSARVISSADSLPFEGRNDVQFQSFLFVLFFFVKIAHAGNERLINKD